ncbi:MAG: ImmA/IrrE family metallo-endopeptidase [Rothia sp. (in: high G+C Gram-positive bacteria)]|nr:ImmA/IrrE family metallo-endopeptidase [Rothia sp. (in: high G+C Gram-positive bacteria)]
MRVKQDENCGCLAQILGYPVEYFSRQPQTAVEVDGINFRAGRAATRSARDFAVAAGVTGIEVMQWVEDKFTLPSIVVSSFEGIAPRVAAQLLREEWGLGTKPLPNLVQLCESRGISVMVLPDAAMQVDGLSLWYEGKPFIFIARQKTPERARFDIAHELGHLVLHQFAPVDDSLAVQEREADEFASALLMPESLLAEYLPQNASADDLVEAKYIFQVSAFAFSTRLRLVQGESKAEKHSESGRPALRVVR